MKKIVVFDYGWGGEMVADFLSKELGVVEVVRVIDWGHAEEYNESVDRAFELAERSLEKYLSKVDLIVLGGYSVSVLYDLFCEKFPGQKFVRMGISREKVCGLSCAPSEIAVLGESFALHFLRDELVEALGDATMILPDCVGWEYLIDQDLMTKDILRSELACDFVLCSRKRRAVKRKMVSRVYMADMVMAKNGDNKLREAVRNFEKLAEKAKKEEDEWITGRVLDENASGRQKVSPGAVLLLSTHFWAVKSELEGLFGWKVRVLDFREKLLREVCLALRLRGVDGKRAKK